MFHPDLKPTNELKKIIVLFVGTKKQAQEAVQTEAERSGSKLC